jgi:hypothetical protein
MSALKVPVDQFDPLRGVPADTGADKTHGRQQFGERRSLPFGMLPPIFWMAAQFGRADAPQFDNPVAKFGHNNKSICAGSTVSSSPRK